MLQNIVSGKKKYIDYIGIIYVVEIRFIHMNVMMLLNHMSRLSFAIQ